MPEQQITSVEDLVALIGMPTEAVANKDRTVLHDLDRQWLASSPFCLIATANESGACDVSPKGDPAGQLAYVIDDTTIAIAERPGNRRADGYRNILVNPHVGLLFMIPGRGETLRLSGRAEIVRDAWLLDALAADGPASGLALVVQISELFFHCPKCMMHSKLWASKVVACAT